MAIVTSKEMFLSFEAQKKFGKPNLYGCSFFGVSEYGDDLALSGVYQKRRINGKPVFVRMKHMIPKNPQTEKQQAWRAIFADGVTAWHNLTESERVEYNRLAIPYRIEGFNLFLKRYLYEKKKTI